MLKTHITVSYPVNMEQAHFSLICSDTQSTWAETKSIELKQQCWRRSNVWLHPPVCVLWGTSALWAVSPDSVHGRGGGAALTGDVRLSKLSYDCTQTAPAKSRQTEGHWEKGGQRVDGWRQLIGLSITTLLQSGVIKAGLVGFYK